MKRAIIKEFEQLGEMLSNYSGMLSYRLKNLCVKAEEVSLLPVFSVLEIGLWPSFRHFLRHFVHKVTQKFASNKIKPYLCTHKSKERDVAQLVAHTSGGREVASSSLVIPT